MRSFFPALFATCKDFAITMFDPQRCSQARVAFIVSEYEVRCAALENSLTTTIESMNAAVRSLETRQTGLTGKALKNNESMLEKLRYLQRSLNAVVRMHREGLDDKLVDDLGWAFHCRAKRNENRNTPLGFKDILGAVPRLNERIIEAAVRCRRTAKAMEKLAAAQEALHSIFAKGLSTEIWQEAMDQIDRSYEHHIADIEDFAAQARDVDHV